MTLSIENSQLNTEPLISIVTVCLNAHELIERCINSVLNQTYKNIEYIIIDGGSTDGTLDIIRKYEDRITYWVSEKDRGIYDAMNKGIALCKGSYIGLLNSDDYYEKDAVKIIVDTIHLHHGVDVIHGNAIIFRNNEYKVTNQNHDNLLQEMTINHTTCFVKASVYNEHKFDTSFKICGDYELMVRLMHNGKRIIHINKAITNYTPYGISTRPSFVIPLERFRIRYKYNKYLSAVLLLKDGCKYLDALSYSIKQKTRNKNG